MSDEPDAGTNRAVPDDDTPDGVVDHALDRPAGESGDSDVSVIKPDVVQEQPAGGLEVDDNGDVTSGGSDREAALVGAASAGSARAAARRSGVRAGTTVAKGTATRPRDTGREKRVGLFARLQRFLREVVSELRKVIWPARNQMVTYTIVVIVFVVFMVALTAGLDVLFAKGVLAVFG